MDHADERREVAMSYYARNPDDLTEAEERKLQGPLTKQQSQATARALTALIVGRDKIEDTGMLNRTPAKRLREALDAIDDTPFGDLNKLFDQMAKDCDAAVSIEEDLLTALRNLTLRLDDHFGNAGPDTDWKEQAAARAAIARATGAA